MLDLDLDMDVDTPASGEPTRRFIVSPKAPHLRSTSEKL